MANNERELADYIRKQLCRGATKKQVKDVLLKVGHNLDTINHALEQIQSTEKRSNVIFGAIAAVALLIVLGWIFFGFMSSQPSTVQERTYDAPSAGDDMIPAGGQEPTDTFLRNQEALAKGDADLCKEAGAHSDNCVMAIGVAEGDPALCDQLDMPGLRDQCYSKIALEQQNLSLCRLSNSFEEQCISQLALKTYNPDICNELSSKKEECFSALALLLRDKSLCEQAGRLKTNCLLTIK